MFLRLGTWHSAGGGVAAPTVMMVPGFVVAWPHVLCTVSLTSHVPALLNTICPGSWACEIAMVGSPKSQSQVTPAPPPDASRNVTVSPTVPLVVGVALMAGLGRRQPPPPPPPPPLLVGSMPSLIGKTELAVTFRSEPTMKEMSGVMTWKRHTSVTAARAPMPMPPPSMSVNVGGAGSPGASGQLDAEASALIWFAYLERVGPSFAASFAACFAAKSVA